MSLRERIKKKFNERCKIISIIHEGEESKISSEKIKEAINRYLNSPDYINPIYTYIETIIDVFVDKIDEIEKRIDALEN